MNHPYSQLFLRLLRVNTGPDRKYIGRSMFS